MVLVRVVHRFAFGGIVVKVCLEAREEAVEALVILVYLLRFLSIAVCNGFAVGSQRIYEMLPGFARY